MKLIHFDKDRAFVVRAENDRYLVATRTLDVILDQKALIHSVEMEEYFDLETAFENISQYPVYTILDKQEKVRAGSTAIFLNVTTKRGCEDLLKDITEGDTELSKRSIIPCETWTFSNIG